MKNVEESSRVPCAGLPRSFRVPFEARLRRLVLTVVLFAGPCIDAGVIQVSMGDNAGPFLNGPAGGSGSIWNDWRSLDGPLQDSIGAVTPVTFTTGGDGPHGDWWCDLGLLSSGSHGDDGIANPLW